VGRRIDIEADDVADLAANLPQPPPITEEAAEAIASMEDQKR
jgi:hypothetical protein